MKCFAVLFVSVVVLGFASSDSVYFKTFSESLDRVKRQLPGIPSQFQNINIENYLRNAKAVQFQLKCVIYEGPCDSIGKYLKRNIPIWLRTQCRNCNDDQKKQAGKLINFFQESYAKEWSDAVKKFAKGTFTDEEIMRFETELGVKIESGGGAPVASNKKPDHNALANLAKESLAILKTTKEPLVLEVSSTPASGPGAKSVDVAPPAPAATASAAPVATASETTAASTTAAPAASSTAAEAEVTTGA